MVRRIPEERLVATMRLFVIDIGGCHRSASTNAFAVPGANQSVSLITAQGMLVQEAGSILLPP